MNCLDKIEQYLYEQEDGEEEEDALDSDNAQKVQHLAVMMDAKKKVPLMKRVVGKAMKGKPLSDSERMVLSEIMGRVFRPDKNKFRRLMKKF